MNQTSYLSPEFLEQLRHVVCYQRELSKSIEAKVDDLEKRFQKLDALGNDFADASKLLNNLEANIDMLTASDLDECNLTVDELNSISIDRKIKAQQELSCLNFTTWNSFVSSSKIQLLRTDSETLPWNAMLTDKDIEQLKSESYGADYKWSKWDYIFVGLAGTLASLCDYFLVKIPKTITYGGEIQEGSPITGFLKKHIDSSGGSNTYFSNLANNLEKSCKVPYDAVANGGLGGLTGRTHRLQTFGHDPILGLVFGVFDIMRGSITGFSYDKLLGEHTFRSLDLGGPATTNILQAFMMQIGHLVSDLGTKMGVQPPFFTLFQGINLTSPFSEKNRNIGEICRWMYLNGYDLRHFITMGLVPATIEIILRLYLMISHYHKYGETKFLLANNPKYRSMLLSAHAIACAGNVGKVALMQGNPLAINYAEWLAMVRYLIPSLKYWIFDKHKLKIAHIKNINDSEWDNLLESSDCVLKEVYKNDIKLIQIGTNS